MLEYLNTNLFTYENLSISIASLLYILLLVIAGGIIDFALRKLLLRFIDNSYTTSKQILRLRKWTRIIITGIVVMVVLKIVGINSSRFFEAQIISTKTINFTIYDLIVAILILYGTKVLVKFIRKFIDNHETFDIKTGRTVYHISKYLIWIISFGIVLQTVGLDFKIILAGSAALLVGIGLGLQQIFNDIISGLFILFEGNLKMDDVVELDDGTIGKVKEIGIRTSRIVTRDNVILIIPNSRFVGHKVINWSLVDLKTRISIDVGVSYESDIELVRQVLLECAAEHSKIIKTPKPIVIFKNFGESSLDFELKVWTTDVFRAYKTKSDIRFLIFNKFRKNKISIPFPQRDLHIIKD